MRPTTTVESILGTRSRVAVLRLLRGINVPLNASQIASRTGLTRPAVTSVLHDFAAMGIVRSSSAGRANVHSLEHDNIYVERMIAPLFNTEEHLPDDLTEELRTSFENLTASIVLFGSYARGDQDESSDVDVVLVARDRESQLTIERTIDAYSVRFRRRFGATLSPLVYSTAEAADLLHTAPNLAESLRSDAFVISGTSPWEWLGDG